MQYDELKVRVEPGDDGTYRVQGSGESGETTGVFRLPFSDPEVEDFIRRVGRPRRGTRRLESPEMELARDFGTKLFAALFDGNLRDLYRESFSQAQGKNHGLRLKLAFVDAPELATIPWEYLYSSPMFLSVSQFTPIIRYLELPRSRPPLAIEPPLRILVVISAPTGEAALNVDAEREKIERALSRLSDRKLVEITWLKDATLRALQQELQRRSYHVFHYVGHGIYDEAFDESVLLFEDEDGRRRPVSGTQLGTILADHHSLRLATLTACEGARTSRDDPFAGVAAALVQYELPAVIAMQFEITDAAAVTFSDELYGALANGLPIDAALAEARKAIYAEDNDIEWATPVLFMRTKDGRLFDLPEHMDFAPPDGSSDTTMTTARAEQSDAKLSTPADQGYAPASAVERKLTPSQPSQKSRGPLAVPRHLVVQLKQYPRLRDLVLGYLIVQERIARYKDIMTDLDNAAESPDRQFWARLSEKLDALGGDFLTESLDDPQFERLVATFDSERANLRAAAMVGRRSAQSTEAAYPSVTAILEAAEELAVLCKGEARSLLGKLSEAVNKIFADEEEEEEEPRESAGETVRVTGSSGKEERDQLAPTERGGLSKKALGGSVAVADVQGHVLAKRRAT